MTQMKRVTEPELMEDPVQVAAYASADFSVSHDRLIDQIAAYFPQCEFDGTVLNLGCGSGDDTFRFLKRFPKSSVIAVDGSAAMLARAEEDLRTKHPELRSRVEFILGYIPGAAIPDRKYVGIVSNSLLHHMPDPAQFWLTVRAFAKVGTPIFVADLKRPVSPSETEDFVRTYAEGAPKVLQEDFYNSLRAAFSREEIKEQLEKISLAELAISEIGDRHLIIHGCKS